jgi:pimeloyl-ACP methyl ester carboxylesterase
MVGPSVTDEDRKRFLKRLKIGFALFVGLSMGLVTLWGGAELLVVVAAAVSGTVAGGILGWFTIPDSIGETPDEDQNGGRDRGPKPGTRMKQRQNDETPRRADGDGQPPSRDRN